MRYPEVCPYLDYKKDGTAICLVNHKPIAELFPQKFRPDLFWCGIAAMNRCGYLNCYLFSQRFWPELKHEVAEVLANKIK